MSNTSDVPFLNKTEQFSTLKNIKKPIKPFFPLQRRIIARKSINTPFINKDSQSNFQIACLNEEEKRMKKFGNTANKIRAILNVVDSGERLKGRDIANRLKTQGYEARDGNINMFIYHYMLYKYLDRERVNGINYYYPI